MDLLVDRLGFKDGSGGCESPVARSLVMSDREPSPVLPGGELPLMEVPVLPPAADVTPDQIIAANTLQRERKQHEYKSDGRGSGTHIRNGRNKVSEGHSGYEIKELKDWHRQVSDWFLLNPGAKIKNAAYAFHVSAGWMGRLIQSDLYRAYFGERLAAHQKLVSESVVAAAGDAALKGMHLIGEKLEQQGTAMDMEALVKATALTSKAIGLGLPTGSSGAAGPAVVFNLQGVNPERLAAAREQMKTVGENNSLAIEAEAVENIPPLAITETEEDQKDDGFISELVSENLGAYPASRF